MRGDDFESLNSFSSILLSSPRGVGGGGRGGVYCKHFDDQIRICRICTVIRVVKCEPVKRL